MSKLAVHLTIATILLFIGFGLAYAGEYGNIGCAKIATGTGIIRVPVVNFDECTGSFILDMVLKYYPLVVLFFAGIYYEYKHERNNSRVFIYIIIATLIIIGLLFLFILSDLRNLSS